MRAPMPDPGRARFAGTDRAILDSAVKLARDPRAMRGADVET